MRLIFNACEGNLQLLLTENNIILCAQDWNAPRSSTEILTPAISQILTCFNLRPADLNSIACVNGPGSFTGIRLTLSTAAAMRRVLNIPVAGINYLQALALSCHIYLEKQLSVSEIPRPVLCWVLTHAKRNFVHAQLYELKLNSNETEVPSPISPIKIMSIDDICAAMQISQENSDTYCLGSGLIRNSVLIRQACLNIRFLTIDKVCNMALNILAQAGTYLHNDLEPIYTRQCDAIDNLAHIAEKQGLDPEKRHAELKELLQRPIL